MTNEYIAGRNSVSEALRSGRDIYKLFVLKGQKNGSIIPIINQAKARKISIQEVSREELNKMTSENHQGVIAAVQAYHYAELEDLFAKAEAAGEAPFFVILESIQDPHNLGAIIRTAETAGVHGVIIGKNRSVGLTGAVAKTAAGALEYVPVVQVTNLSRTIDDLKKRGVWVMGADMDGDIIYQCNLTGPLALVIGGEHEGVGRLVKEHCDGLVKLPMSGHITSLNASVAAGIVIYEAVRQRGK